MTTTKKAKMRSREEIESRLRTYTNLQMDAGRIMHQLCIKEQATICEQTKAAIKAEYEFYNRDWLNLAHKIKMLEWVFGASD